MLKLKAWWHDRMGKGNQSLLEEHFIPSALRRAEVAFINHETPLSFLDYNENLQLVASNTTQPIVPPGPYDRVWLSDPSVLRTITPTAEHTLCLAMMAHRQLRQAMVPHDPRWLTRYLWSVPKMLTRSTLTVLGAEGRIGSRVCRMASLIVGELHRITRSDCQNWGDTEDLKLRATDLLLCCASHHGEVIVDSAMLELLPPQAVVVNTSDKRNLDHDALLAALEAGHLRGAALDVWPSDHSGLITYYQNSQNLILTPHIGGSTIDAWDETQEWVILETLRRLNIA